MTIGVAGLSVGHVIAHTLALQGLCGELRLADFDNLELSNLNRVPATVFDLGVNKAKVAARRIAEVDPYLPIDVHRRTDSTSDTVDDFVDGLDIVVEECDSLDMKAVVREAARTPRHPRADGHQRSRPGRRRTLRPASRSGRSCTDCSAKSTRGCFPG